MQAQYTILIYINMLCIKKCDSVAQRNKVLRVVLTINHYSMHASSNPLQVIKTMVLLKTMSMYVKSESPYKQFKFLLCTLTIAALFLKWLLFSCYYHTNNILIRYGYPGTNTDDLIYLLKMFDMI